MNIKSEDVDIENPSSQNDRSVGFDFLDSIFFYLSRACNVIIISEKR